MLLDLSEIVVRQGMRVDLEVDQPGVEDPDLEFAEPIRGRLTFVNSGDLLNIHGALRTTLRLRCSRCLAEVCVPVDLAIEEHFPISEVLNPGRGPSEGGEFDGVVSSVVYLEQGRPILDLDELIRQLLVMEIPIRTLCDEACRGLCPRCGANRNVTPCLCEEETTHRPLAGLAALLEEEPEQR